MSSPTVRALRPLGDTDTLVRDLPPELIGRVETHDGEVEPSSPLLAVAIGVFAFGAIAQLAFQLLISGSSAGSWSWVVLAVSLTLFLGSRLLIRASTKRR